MNRSKKKVSAASLNSPFGYRPIPPTAQKYYRQALAFHKRGNKRSYFKAMTRAVRLDPNCVEKKTVGVEDAIDRTIPKPAQEWCRKGVAFVERGYYLRAIKALNQAVNLAPNYAEAWRNLLRVYAGLPKIEIPVTGGKLKGIVMAEKAFNKIIELTPHDTSPWYELIRAYSRTDRYDKVLQLLESACRHFPKDLKSQMWIVDVYEGMGKDAEAVKLESELLGLTVEQFQKRYPSLDQLNNRGRRHKTPNSRAATTKLTPQEVFSNYYLRRPYPWEYTFSELTRRNCMYGYYWRLPVRFGCRKAASQYRTANNITLAKTATTVLKLLLKQGDDEEALAFYVQVLLRAVNRLNESRYETLKTVARRLPVFPVNMSRVQKEIDRERAALDGLGLGDRMRFNISPANKLDWHDWFTVKARELVTYVAESRAAYLRWKAGQSKVKPKKSIPKWVVNAAKLPPFQRSSVKEWQHIVGEVFRHLYPDLRHNIPPHKVLEIRYQPSRATTDGRVYNSMVDVIKKRVASIAPAVSADF